MEIDGFDGSDGHIYRLKFFFKYRKYKPQREINETNLKQNMTEELILLA